MLIPTENLTNEGRIPSGLLKIYVQYKQDTRAIVAWLISHGKREYKGGPTLSINDLFKLAAIVQKTAVELPDILHFHFREAIAARKQLSNFFRNVGLRDDHQTANHEYFTERYKDDALLVDVGIKITRK